MRKADNLPTCCAFVTKSGNLNFLEPSGPFQACNGTALPFSTRTTHSYFDSLNRTSFRPVVFQYSLHAVVWTVLWFRCSRIIVAGGGFLLRRQRPLENEWCVSGCIRFLRGIPCPWSSDLPVTCSSTSGRIYTWT